MRARCERSPCPPRPPQRRPQVRPAAAERVRVPDGRGLAAQRRAGVYDPPASRARRARRDRRRGRRPVAEALPDHLGGRPSAGRLASYSARARPAATRRAGDQDPGGTADPGHRHPRAPAGAPPACDRGHAALHPDQGGGRRGRCGARARRRCGALPTRSDRALARLCGRPPEAAEAARTAHRGRSAEPTRPMEVSQ